MKGSTFLRCGCRDETGRQLGSRCPRLGKKGHGAWWGRYDEPRKEDGRRRQTKLGPFPTRREAEAALAEVLDRVNKGTHVETDRGLTVGRYLDDWLVGKMQLKASTRRSYATHIALYLRPGLGHLRLDQVRDTDFEDLYAAMRLIGRPRTGRPSPMLGRLLEARTNTPQAQRPLTPARIRRVHATAMSALNSAVRRRKIARNPAEHVELERGRAPKALVWTDERVAAWQRTGRRPSPVMVWTPAQTGTFLDAVAGDQLSALWHLIAYRGLRRAEAVWLPWSDVDLDAGTATIREGGAGGWDGPKSDAGERTVALDPGTVEVLRTHRRAQTEARMAWGPAWQDSGLVFTTDDGRPLNPDSVSQRFDRLVVRHGVPPIRLHDLRHVAASLALWSGQDIKLVSEQLGHANTQITRDIYLSVMPQVAQSAAAAAAAIVPRAAQAAGSDGMCPPGAHQGPDRAAERTASRAKPQVRSGGVGGTRTRDRGIMSPLL